MVEGNCGRCGRPIHANELGIRYFGNTRAHAEHRCIQILKMEIEMHESLEAVNTGTYIEKVDDLIKCHDALRAIYALIGEDAQITKIIMDVLEETGGLS